MRKELGFVERVVDVGFRSRWDCVGSDASSRGKQARFYGRRTWESLGETIDAV